MGQATLDLPDPLEQPPESAAGTDELLAQLAGDEIDRMLAEADQESAAAAAPQVAAPNVTEAPRHPSLPETAPAVAEGSPAAAQLGDFLGQIASERPFDTSSPQAKPPTAPTADDVSHCEAALNKLLEEAESPEEDAGVVAAERGALKTAEARPLEAAIAAGPAAVVRQGSVRSSSPIFLRLLAWLNSPLDSLSDDARDLVGKIAILTMVNALSVLVYVLFFRRHH